VANGDPSSHEPDKCDNDDWQRHLFNGKCQVILKSGVVVGATGSILTKLTVTGEGLEPATVTF